ncbi:MAG: deoxyuridine 5-triphosphate nucleotidohydrolase, partial [Actinomycetota bacterium]
MPNIHIKRLDTDLPLPQLAHVGDAGLDVYSAIDVVLAPNGGRVLVPAGIAISIPLGYAGFVLPRSGLALNHGISLVNTPGLIDSHYRGEIKVVMVNTDQSRPYHV